MSDMELWGGFLTHNEPSADHAFRGASGKGEPDCATGSPIRTAAPRAWTTPRGSSGWGRAPSTAGAHAVAAAEQTPRARTIQRFPGRGGGWDAGNRGVRTRLMIDAAAEAHASGSVRGAPAASTAPSRWLRCTSAPRRRTSLRSSGAEQLPSLHRAPCRGQQLLAFHTDADLARARTARVRRRLLEPRSACPCWASSPNDERWAGATAGSAQAVRSPSDGPSRARDGSRRERSPDFGPLSSAGPVRHPLHAA